MPLSPQDLKEKLLQTIDNDYNVIDMAGAFEIVSILEKYPITKEELENTRIGKHVNDIRKKTTDKTMAKRMKNLVRKWRILLGPSLTPAKPATTEIATTVNGKGPITDILLEGHPHLRGIQPASPLSRPETPCSVRSGVSSPRSIYGMVALPTFAGKKDGNEIVNSCGALTRHVSEVPLCTRSMVGSPSIEHHLGATVHSQHRLPPQKLHSAPTTPMNSTNLVSGPADVRNVGNAVEQVMSGKRKREDDQPLQPIKLKIRKKNSDVEDVHHAALGSDTWSCTPETTQKSNINGLLGSHHNAAPIPSTALVNETPQNTLATKPRRGRPPNSAKAAAAQLARASSAASTYSAASAGKADSTGLPRPDLSSLPGCTPKVATTAEIIQKLHASGELRLVASDTVKNIVSNRIIKEAPYENESVVPAAAKPRPRKKNFAAMPPTTPDMTMSQIKNEMVQRFLNSSVQSSPNPNSDALNFLKHLDPPLESDSSVNQGASSGPKKSALELATEAQSTTNRSDRNGAEPAALDYNNPWSLLPPIDQKQTDWSSLEYEALDPDDRPPVTNDDVERLHFSQWSGVNGQYDFRNEWSDWTKSFSVPSYSGELLHILPYVNITE